MPRLTASRAQRALEAFERDRPALLAVDTETTGVTWNDTPFAATVTWRHSVPVGGRHDWLESHYFELSDSEQWAAFASMLPEAQGLIFHNAKFDLQKLILEGLLAREHLTAARFENTETIAHLLDENRLKGLKPLAVSELGYDDTIEVEVKSGPNKGQLRKVPREKHELDSVRRKLKLRKEDGYEPLPRRVVIPYALRDTEFTLQLFELMYPQLEAAGLTELYEREKELELALLDIEAAGMGVDVPTLESLQSEFREKRFDAELALREAAGNPELNPGSWQQLLEVLHSAGIPVESTEENELKRFDHPLVAAVLEYRGAHKVLSTYVDNLLAEQEDGIWHPWFRANGARTGRMSSSSATA